MKAQPRTYEDGGQETGGKSHTDDQNAYDSAWPDRYIHTIELHYTYLTAVPSWDVPNGDATIVNMKLFFSDGYDTGTWYGCFNGRDLPSSDCDMWCCPILPSENTTRITVTRDSTYKLVGAELGSVENGYFGYIQATFEYAKSAMWTNVNNNKTFSSNNLTTGQRLQANQALWSDSRLSKLLLSKDGNLAIYNMYDSKTWETKTRCDEDAAFLDMQPDGNLVLYCHDTNTAIWASDTDDGEDLCRVAVIENTGAWTSHCRSKKGAFLAFLPLQAGFQSLLNPAGALTIYSVPDLAGVWSSSSPIPVGFGGSNLTSPHSLQPGQRLVQSLG